MEKSQETKNLQELARKMLGKQLITNDDFQSGLNDIINAFAQYRSASQTINKETRDTLNLIVKQVNVEHDRILADVEKTTEEASTSIKSNLQSTKSNLKESEKLVSDCKKMCDKITILMDKLPENGYTPIKGVDYFDDESIDEETVIEEVVAKVPKETPETVREKLETLKDDERLDISAIKGWEKVLEGIKNTGKVVLGSPKFLSYLFGDVAITTPTNGQGLVYDSTLGKWKNGTVSGGGLTVYTTASTIDDTNVTFVFAVAPTFVTVNGKRWRSGSQENGATVWTNVAGTVTLLNPVGTGGDIYAEA